MNADAYLCHQSLALFKSLLYQIVTQIHLNNDIFVVTPAGEEIPSQVLALLFDVLPMLLQHKLFQINLFSSSI